MVLCYYCVVRLQESERDRRLPSQSGHGGAGPQAGLPGVDLLRQNSNHLLVYMIWSMICMTTFTEHCDVCVERGRQLYDHKHV